MWTPTLWQLLKNQFDNSNSTYTYTFKNLSEKALVLYRRVLNDLLKTLAEAVSELWKERTEAIKKLLEQIHTEEIGHFQVSGIHYQWTNPR